MTPEAKGLFIDALTPLERAIVYNALQSYLISLNNQSDAAKEVKHDTKQQLIYNTAAYKTSKIIYHLFCDVSPLELDVMPQVWKEIAKKG